MTFIKKQIFDRAAALWISELGRRWTGMVLLALAAICVGFGLGWAQSHRITPATSNATIVGADTQWRSTSVPNQAAPAIPNEWLARMWQGSLGKIATLRDTPLTQPNWRIAGSAVSAEGTGLVVVFEGQNVPTFIHVGEALPGGGKLVAIGADFATVQMDKKTVYLPLSSAQK